jgi:hypothetical protein
MDMPPSGWYPDPYGVPGLLRWWDGSVWTDHTQSYDAPAASTGEAAAQQAPRAAAAGPPPVTSFDIPPAIDPPPATTFDLPPVPAAGQAHPATEFDLPAAFNAPGESTRMFSPDDYAGYARDQAQRRVRRRWLMSALAAGTAVILVVMAMALMRFGKQPTKPVALTTRSPAAKHTTPAASPSPSPSAASPTAQLTDGSSGLAYAKFGSPWQATCPSGLNQQGFGWTAGESDVAGQVTINGQQSSWYGNACSAPLPSQYGYSGVADLSTMTSTLATTFENSFYNGLDHTTSQVTSTPLQVSGHPAWEIKYLISYTNASGQGLAWTSEEGAVLVADRGTGVEPAVFFVSMPSNLGTTNVNTLLNSLALSASSTTASPSASATVPASPSASPTSQFGGGGNDNGNGNGNGGNGNGGGGHFP